MDPGNFRTRWALADLDRVHGQRSAADPWTPALDPADGPTAICAPTAMLLRRVAETGTFDPALERLRTTIPWTGPA
jgi:hypothetical protein